MKAWCVSWLVLGLCVNGFQVLASWYSVQPAGTESGLWYTLFYVFPLMLAAVLALPVFVLAALFARARKVAAFGLIAATLWLLTGFVTSTAADKVRMSGMRRLAKRSMPLVRAIELFEAEHARPPGKLDDLVPKYLPAVPDTGLGAYPNYELVTGKAAAYYENNPWVVLVSTPSGGINFDVMAYFPRQNYPAVGQSGWWERVGAWAYLHE